MTTLTIEVDDDLHAQLAARAVAESRPLAEFVVRAVKERVARTCERCGADEKLSAIYGFSAPVEALLKAKPNGDFCVLTVTVRNGVGTDFVYAGRVRHNVPQDGSVSLWIAYTMGIGTGYCPVALPRSILTSAQEDPTATLHQQYLVQGYADGNAAVLTASGILRVM